MATKILTCERHGEPTRLTCVECNRPICPRCLVRTEVGLKCEQCAQPVPVPAGALGRRSRMPLVLAGLGVAVLAVAIGITALRSSSDGGPAARRPTPVGQWSDAPPLTAIRGTTAAVVLPDGTAMVTGGGVGAIPLAATELFDPATGAWRAGPSLHTPRRGHQAVALADGRVLVAGGIAEGELLASTEVFDPEASAWSRAAPLRTARLGHSLTLLADGRVLAAGGTAQGAEAGAGTQTVAPEASVELYDPRTNTWTQAGALAVGRFEHTATLLPDGRVLLAGGLGLADGRLSPLADTEIYDPAAGVTVRTTAMGEPRTNHAAALLPDGSVLVTGGAGGANGDVALGSAELFDPRSATWRTTQPLAEPRTGHTATTLADGRVLAAGGESVSRGSRRSLATAELYSPDSGDWHPAGTTGCPRSEHAAVLLPDGSVLLVAGDTAFPGKAPVAQNCTNRYRI